MLDAVGWSWFLGAALVLSAIGLHIIRKITTVRI